MPRTVAGRYPVQAAEAALTPTFQSGGFRQRALCIANASPCNSACNPVFCMLLDKAAAPPCSCVQHASLGMQSHKQHMSPSPIVHTQALLKPLTGLH